MVGKAIKELGFLVKKEIIGPSGSTLLLEAMLSVITLILR